MKLSPTILRAFVLGSVLLAPAHATDVTYSTTTGPIAVGNTVNVTLPKFDPALGVLRSVTASGLSSISGTWSVENLTASPNTFGGYGGAYVTGLVSAGFPATSLSPMNPSFLFDPALTLPAFDGTIDYGGTSGTILPFTNAYGDGGPGQYAAVYMDSGLSAYVGTGTITVSATLSAVYVPTMPPGFQTSASATASTLLQVLYTYDSPPTRICRATPFSGCPCSNSSPISNGCGNSSNANGGSLNVSGTASITSDSLVLSGGGMPNGGALYFEGTSFGYAQTVYGDGLLCVGGSIVRLGVKFNAAGASQHPVAGDPSISSSTGITAPGVRSYQVWYRDAASYCTPATFNFTNGYAVQWVP
jgi:hypothetical protein